MLLNHSVNGNLCLALVLLAHIFLQRNYDFYMRHLNRMLDLIFFQRSAQKRMNCSRSLRYRYKLVNAPRFLVRIYCFHKYNFYIALHLYRRFRRQVFVQRRIYHLRSYNFYTVRCVCTPVNFQLFQRRSIYYLCLASHIRCFCNLCYFYRTRLNSQAKKQQQG